MSHHRNIILTASFCVAIFTLAILSFVLPTEASAKKDKQAPTAAETIKKLLDKNRSKLTDKQASQSFLTTRTLAMSDLGSLLDPKDVSNGDGQIQGTLTSDSQLQMPNSILMPENQNTPPVPTPSPTQIPAPTPTPVVLSQAPRKTPTPTPTPAAQAQPTPQKELAMNIPLKDAASQVIEQVTTDLPSIPSQPVIDALSQSSNLTNYYSWDRIEKKTMYNFLALAAFLAALGLLLMSGALENLRNRNRQAQDFASPGITPSES